MTAMTRPDVTITTMTQDFLLWRCLHGGPLDRRSIEQWEPNSSMPWAALRARNVPLLRKFTQVYGACAVVALAGERVVGQLRFYPKHVCSLSGAGGMCLQQDFPNGPAEDFAGTSFPPLSELQDKTLLVHCLMTGSPQQPENPYQRKGIGSGMARALVEWARASGWRAVEAYAYQDLPLIYAITGTAGKRFWDKLGFRVAEAGVEQAMVGEGEEGFGQALRRQAQECGLPPDSVTRKYTMRLDLP